VNHAKDVSTKNTVQVSEEMVKNLS